MPLKDQNLLNSEELMERWQISELDLLKMLVDGELKHYRVDDLLQEKQITTRIKEKGHSQLIKLEHLPEIAFAVDDVEEYEKKHPEFEPEKTIGKALRRVGQLEREKKTLDLQLELAVKAAVQIGIYVKDIGKVFLRDEITDKLRQLSSNKLHDKSIERILRAIPEEYRQGSGPRRKEDDQDKI